MAKGTKTGGRKKGSKNRRTALLDAAAKSETLPLDYMLEVMRDCDIRTITIAECPVKSGVRLGL